MGLKRDNCKADGKIVTSVFEEVRMEGRQEGKKDGSPHPALNQIPMSLMYF